MHARYASRQSLLATGSLFVGSCGVGAGAGAGAGAGDGVTDGVPATDGFVVIVGVGAVPFRFVETLGAWNPAIDIRRTPTRASSVRSAAIADADAKHSNMTRNLDFINSHPTLLCLILSKAGHWCKHI